MTGLVGIYSDPKHIILYTSNGEAGQEFSIVLTALVRGSTPATSSESLDVRWHPIEELDMLRMDLSMRLRLRHLREGRTSPYIHRLTAISDGRGQFCGMSCSSSCQTTDGSTICTPPTVSPCGKARSFVMR